MDSLYLFLKSLCDPLFPFFVLAGIALLLWRRTKVFLSLFLGLYLLSIRPVADGLNLTLETGCSPSPSDLTNIEAVVVLGGGTTGGGPWRDGQPSLETAERLLLGLQVFETSGARYLALSGGHPFNSSAAEAGVMAEIAKRLGVPPDRLIIERESHNTHEHPARLSQFPQLHDRKIALVTSSSHMRRASMNFRRYFDQITPVPAGCLQGSSRSPLKLLLPQTHSLYRSAVAIHELAGLIKDRFFVSGRT